MVYKKLDFILPKKALALTLVILIIATPLIAQQTVNDYLQGKADGERDGSAAANPLWIVAGLGCGILGVGAAYFITPSAPVERLVGKSPEYVAGYSEAYKNSARNRQTLYACAGWLSWVLIYLVILSMQESTY